MEAPSSDDAGEGGGTSEPTARVAPPTDAHEAPSERHERPWFSRLWPSARELAEIDDPQIDALDAEARRELGAVWQRRGEAELHVGSGFAALANDLFAHGAPPEVMNVVARALRDELRHARISVDLAARYRGDAARWPAPIEVSIPTFPGSSGALRVAVTVASLSCLNETLACALLELAIERCASPIVRAGLRSILRDEIEHARVGWAYVGSSFVSREVRGAMGPWLVRICSAKLTELAGPGGPLPGERFPNHGLLDRATTQAAIADTLAEVIVPGWARAGFDVAPLRDWAKRTFAGHPSWS